MIMVISTFPSMKTARKALKNLVTKGLAPCTSIIKIEGSIYKWKGKLMEEKEFMVMVKAEDGNYKRIENELKKAHPYEVQEIIAFKITNANKDYIDWVNKNSR